MGCIRHVVNNELEHLAMSTKAGSECHTIGNTERVLHKAVRVYLRHSLRLALELRPVAWICFPHLSIPIINAKVYVKAALAWKQCNVTAVHILTRLSYASHSSCLALPLFAFVIANVVPHGLCGKCGACNTWLVVCNHAALLIYFVFFFNFTLDQPLLSHMNRCAAANFYLQCHTLTEKEIILPRTLTQTLIYWRWALQGPF